MSEYRAAVAWLSGGWCSRLSDRSTTTAEAILAAEAATKKKPHGGRTGARNVEGGYHMHAIQPRKAVGNG